MVASAIADIRDVMMYNMLIWITVDSSLFLYVRKIVLQDGCQEKDEEKRSWFVPGSLEVPVTFFSLVRNRHHHHHHVKRISEYLKNES